MSDDNAIIAQDNSNLTHTEDEEDLFRGLKSLKTTLAAKNQPLIPALIAIFGTFKDQLVADLQEKLDSTVNIIKNDCLSICKAKDLKINELEKSNYHLRKHVTNLEDKIDATEAYERKDTVIISGAVPGLAANEDTNKVVIDLVRNKLPGFGIEPRDISVSHRLQNKKPNPQGVTFPPNIYVKLVRRDMKKALILASKKINKENPDQNKADKIYINESLTRRRSTVLQTLLKMKKMKIIAGATSIEGDVFAYTSQGQPEASSHAGGWTKDKSSDRPVWGFQSVSVSVWAF